MSREHLFAAFFFAAFAYLLYQFLHILSFFVGPLSWAALLALTFFPLQTVLVRWSRRRDGLVAFLLTTVVILTVIVPTIWLMALLARESVTFYEYVNEIVADGRVNELMQQAQDSTLGRLWQRIMPRLETWDIDVAAAAVTASKSVSAFLAAQAPAAAAGALRSVASFFLTTFALFFFFRDGHTMVQALRDLIPMEREHKDAILSRLYETLSAVVQGTLATAAMQGVLAGIGFWMVSVPFAVLLGGLTAFLSLLPYVGPVVWVTVVLYLLAITEYTSAMILVAWCVIIVGSADNILRPLIIGGRARIPTVFLFFGILGGLQAYGFLGIFLGPALIAILLTFVGIYREEYGATPERPLEASSD